MWLKILLLQSSSITLRLLLVPIAKEHLSSTYFSSDSDVNESVENFFKGNMNFTIRQEYKSCRNDKTNALKFVEIMSKNKLVTVVVLCFFI